MLSFEWLLTYWKSINHLVNQLVNQYSNEASKQSVFIILKYCFEEFAEKYYFKWLLTYCKSINISISQSDNFSVGRLVCQSFSKSVRQSVNQSTKRLIRVYNSTVLRSVYNCCSLNKKQVLLLNILWGITWKL